MSSAIEYLHSINIFHRDLKFQNIIMTGKDDNAIPKIIDFGLARILLPNEMET